MIGIVQSSFINVVQDLFEFGASDPKKPAAEKSEISCTIQI